MDKMIIGMKMRNKSGSKAQSAMEYLMTYGWAILIIAVVLGALYYLGVFNTSNLAPKAQPGSCKVIRPNGPGTTTFINLAGICNGQLPMFVAQFNGASSYILLPNAVELTGAHTVSFWMEVYNLPTVTTNTPAIFGGYGLGAVDAQGGISFTYKPSGFVWVYNIYNSINKVEVGVAANGISTGTWYFVALTWDGTSASNAVNIYLNKNLVASTTGLSGPLAWSTRTFNIGYSLRGYYANGSIVNFQLYNTSLSNNEIQGLYAEGIGGAPTRLQNLVGWWPLNGNANDYSGNGYTGTQTNVLFISAWSK